MWNPDDYGGLQKIWLKPDDLYGHVWISDLLIVEDAGDGYFSNEKYPWVRVFHNGSHYWPRVGELAVEACFDFTQYPFDQQTINITIGSWLFDNSRISVNLADQPFVM